MRAGNEAEEGPPMAEHSRRFIPAAGLDWLLPLYDPLQRLFGTVP